MRSLKTNLGSEQGEPVGAAFSRNAKRMVLFIAGFAIVAFAVGSETLLRIQSYRSLAIRAEVFAAAITFRDDADLSACVTRIQSHTDRLVAVATLDESGALRHVCPDGPEERAAAEKALVRLGGTITASGADGVTPIEAVGVIVNLSGGPSRALLVMRYSSYRAAWLKVVAVVTFAVGAVALLRLRTLNRWFERNVARPLREMANLKLDPNAAMTEMPVLQAGAWRETAQIARQFESLLRSFADADTRARRVEQETRRQILHRELGFDMKLKRAKDEATTDPLTRMRNRAFLESELEVIFNGQCERGAPLSAVMIDIDNFKRYNDTHGHQVGDALLRFVGSLLRGGIRPADYAARYGGDEFLLLLPDTETRDAVAIADRLIKLFGQYVGRPGKECGVSMSAGVASTPEEECSSGQMLVARADAALYAAKFDGKNTVATGSGKTSRVNTSTTLNPTTMDSTDLACPAVSLVPAAPNV